MFQCYLHNWFSIYSPCPACLQTTTTTDATGTNEPIEETPRIKFINWGEFPHQSNAKRYSFWMSEPISGEKISKLPKVIEDFVNGDEKEIAYLLDGKLLKKRSSGMYCQDGYECSISGQFSEEMLKGLNATPISLNELLFAEKILNRVYNRSVWNPVQKEVFHNEMNQLTEAIKQLNLNP